MAYHIERLYEHVGRKDQVAVIYFIHDSESYINYGPTITVSFIYGPGERANLEKEFLRGSGKASKTHGKVKAILLVGGDLSKEQIEKLRLEGMNSHDIRFIFTGERDGNLFYEEKKRSIDTIEIPIEREPKGEDYKWMYGFNRELVRKGIGLSPDDREFYLAMKLYFEADLLSKEEQNEIWDEECNLKPKIELKYLEILFDCQIITTEQEQQYKSLLKRKSDVWYEILVQEIADAGLTVKKLAEINLDLLLLLIEGTTSYIPERLNISGKKAIYLDWRGFLHVFIRHVTEFEIGGQSKNKSKFLWSPGDVTMVMKNIISSVNEEIQEFWERNPTKRFSKYGEQSLYFEGDYYTFHIESDGRVSTFHRIKKEI